MNHDFPHPKVHLRPEWVNVLRNESASAEKQQQLTPAQLDLMHQQKWFLALVPKVYGGLEWSLPEIVAFEEAIGWADGSAGWVFTLCSGAGWFGGFLDKQFAQKIFSAPAPCLAGSGAASGTAEIQVDGSFLINGSWKYASGAPHATVFTANCVMQKNGNVCEENGAPVVRAFCLLPEEVMMGAHWNKLGLVASAGHSFSVCNQLLSPERMFEINVAKITTHNILYRFPFLQLAEATIAANYSGMVIHFMEEWESLLINKKGRDGHPILSNPVVQSRFLAVKNVFSAQRNLLFRSVKEVWDPHADDTEYREVTRVAHHFADVCRDTVNQLYPYCGLSVADTSTPISRVWRDFQTGIQHALFMPE